MSGKTRRVSWNRWGDEKNKPPSSGPFRVLARDALEGCVEMTVAWDSEGFMFKDEWTNMAVVLWRPATEDEAKAYLEGQ